MPALEQLAAKPEILWVGSRGGLEQGLVERNGLAFSAISAAGVRGKGPAAGVAGLIRLAKGYAESRRIISRFQPEALFVTGGYVSVPVTLAARRAGVPIIIYLPDIEPGLAIKNLARFADRVAVTVPEAQPFFKPGLAVVTGYPVRAELAAGVTEPVKQQARQQLGLTNDKPVLFVFGGSRGASSLNRTVIEHLPAWLAHCQLIHMTGSLDESWTQAKWAELPPAQQAGYWVAAYLHEEMVPALQAADLVVSRAGASTLGEFPALGLPAILVPYPHAGAHQARNAAYLVRQGAALSVADARIGDELSQMVLDLLAKPERLRAMSQASRQLARPDAAFRLAQEIVGVSHG